MEAELRADLGDTALSSSHQAAPVVAPLSYVLPFPPSVNRYYRHVGYRTLLSREGREYRESVLALLAGRVGQPLSGQLQVQLDLFPPDARRRDWDTLAEGQATDAVKRACGIRSSTLGSTSMTAKSNEL